MHKRAIDFTRQVVAEAIFGAQLNVQSLDAIVGQVVAAKLGDLAAIADRSDQRVEMGVGKLSARSGVAVSPSRNGAIEQVAARP